MYCRQCGNPLHSGDRFCGACGSVVAPVTPEDPQVIPRPAAARSTPNRGNRSSLIARVAGILLVLLVGGGALALVGSGAGARLFGGSDPRDPAFDLILPPLAGQTTAPIMLPAELPNEFENVGVNEDLEGDRYGLTFLTTPPDDLVGGWARAETIGTLEAIPASEYEPDQRFEATSTENVELPDGTEAELSYMDPVEEAAMYGPRWEGTFDKNGYTYLLKADDYGETRKESIEQALSTMVEVPEDTI